MPYCVYIIYSSRLDRYYVGYTMDIIKRLEEHNGGISTFTAKAKDWIVKWKKAFETREQAMFEEKRIKNKKSRKYIEWLIAQAG